MSSRVVDPGVAAGKRKIPRSERLAHYRNFALQIRELAGDEPDAALRDRLMDLARQYAAIAAQLTTKSTRH